MQMKMAYLVKVSNSKIRHHCLHLTETQMQIEKWESFIMKKKQRREREKASSLPDWRLLACRRWNYANQIRGILL